MAHRAKFSSGTLKCLLNPVLQERLSHFEALVQYEGSLLAGLMAKWDVKCLLSWLEYFSSLFKYEAVSIF